MYFFITGVHALHVLIGVGCIATIAVMASRDRFSPAYYTPVDVTGLVLAPRRRDLAVRIPDPLSGLEIMTKPAETRPIVYILVWLALMVLLALTVGSAFCPWAGPTRR
jgi:hypothetical protein